MLEERIVDISEVVSHGYSGYECDAVLDLEKGEGCSEPAYDCMKSKQSIWFANFCEDHLLIAARNREMMRLGSD